MLRFFMPLLLALILLSGCSYFDPDRSDAPGMDVIVGKQFVVQQDSFLVANHCAGLYVTKNCLLLVVTGGYIRRLDDSFLQKLIKVDLPTSLEEYARDPVAANNRLADKGGAYNGKHHDIVATVPKGTIITIVRVAKEFQGEESDGWALYGTLKTQPGVSIQIGPDQNAYGDTGPAWIDNRYRPDSVPRLLPDFLKPAAP